MANISDRDIELLSKKLSHLSSSAFPRKLWQAEVEPSVGTKEAYLTSLLKRDIPVFLEKFGTSLEPADVDIFEPLSCNYEVAWHLKNLRTHHDLETSALKEKTSLIKNRRLAYMSRMVDDGHYFSFEVMRWRDPLLYFEQIGKYVDSESLRFARPGERYSDTLFRQTEEAAFRDRVEREQERENNALEEFDSDEEEAVSGCTTVADNEDSVPKISPEELEQRKEEFTRTMQEKFLAGHDVDFVDYTRIDADATLDDDWLEEVGRDAEEKYFDED